MDEKGKARTGEEVLKLRFEFFKHMTTVSTAATVAVVTVYGLGEQMLRTAAADLEGAGWLFLPVPLIAIGGFFVSLLLSLRGLYLTAEARHTNENSAAISRMLRWSAWAFILGVGLSVFAAVVFVGAPYASVMLALIVVITIGAGVIGSRL